MLRTTITLREDVYEFLVRMFGKRNISKGINEYLVDHIFKERKKKSMFGIDPWLKKTSMSDLRDHNERNL